MVLGAQHGHALPEIGQLGPLPGRRAEVADLLEASDQAQNVRDTDGLVTRSEREDALLLGSVLGTALGCRKVEHHAVQALGRQLREHVQLPPPQLQLAVPLEKTPIDGQRSDRGLGFIGLQELHDRGEIVDGVLQRRARESPGP